MKVEYDIGNLINKVGAKLSEWNTHMESYSKLVLEYEIISDKLVNITIDAYNKWKEGNKLKNYIVYKTPTTFDKFKSLLSGEGLVPEVYKVDTDALEKHLGMLETPLKIKFTFSYERVMRIRYSAKESNIHNLGSFHYNKGDDFINLAVYFELPCRLIISRSPEIEVYEKIGSLLKRLQDLQTGGVTKVTLENDELHLLEKTTEGLELGVWLLGVEVNTLKLKYMDWEGKQ